MESAAPFPASGRCLVGVLIAVKTVLDIGNCLDLNQCRSALGMQSNEIPDSALTASSTLDPFTVGPAYSRIRTEIEGGAWCPRQHISKETHEFLQINFNQLTVVTLVETQGRFGNGQGQEFTEQYKLEYQRENGGRWFTFHNRRGQEILQGNINTYIAELREVDPPIIARQLRFVPYSVHPKAVCLRVELYGCRWTDGVVSYSMPQGERRKDIDLYDAIYDGDVTPVNVSGLTTAILTGKEFTPSKLSNGLGHLTDGIEGQSNFRLDPRGFGVKGYDWIGWRNETFASSTSGNPPSIEMIWKFDRVRNFSAVRMHCNNMFSKEVRVFRQSLVSFSASGVTPKFSAPPVDYRYARDSTSEAARWVAIPLHQHIARLVKIQLFFDTRWMLISEVQFVSEYVTEDFVLETNHNDRVNPRTKSPQVDADVIQQVAPQTVTEIKLKGSKSVSNVTSRTPAGSVIKLQAGNGDRKPNGDDFVSFNSTAILYDEAIGVAVGTLCTVLVFLVIFVVMCCIRQRRSRRNKYDDSTFSSFHGNGTVKCSADLPSSSTTAISNGLIQSTVTSVNGACLTSSPCDFIVPAGGGTSENDDLCRPTIDGDVNDASASPCFRLFSILGRNSAQCHKTTASNARSNIEFYRVPSDREHGRLNRQGHLSRAPHSTGAYSACYDYGDIKPQLFATVDARTTSCSQQQQQQHQTIPTTDANRRVSSNCHVNNVVDPATQDSSLFRLPSVGRTKSIVYPANQSRRSMSRGPPPSYSWENLTSPVCDTYNTCCRRQYSLLALEETEPWMKRETDENRKSVEASASLLGAAELMSSYGLPEFVCKGFRFVEKIGDGLFGEVHLCEADNLADHLTLSSSYDSGSKVTLRSMPSRRLIVVLVKTVKRNLDHRARRELEREIRAMSRVRHANVISLLGVSFHNNQVPYLVLEYPRHGDLVQFLRHHSHVDDFTEDQRYSTMGSNCRQKQRNPTIRYGLLFYIATQIAAGMKHLESLQIVHRDLAARNCLIGEDCQVKVADLGPGRDLYSSDYWCHPKDNSLLPIRWMSWEAVFEGQLSIRSDVWSFGTTLWEVLTYCRTQPLYTLTDQQVLDNLDQMRRSSTAPGRRHFPIFNSVSGVSTVALTLPHRPSGCPSEVYDLMVQCWNSDSDQRPSFHQICQFLQQVNDIQVLQQTWTQRAQ